MSGKLFLASSIFIVLGLARPSYARTWHVLADGTGDAPTIQAGVDSAAAGDIVLVGPGTYTDCHTEQVEGQDKVVNVRIDHDISLQSEQGASFTLIDATAGDIGILVVGVGASAEITGFEIALTPDPFGCIIPADRAQAIQVAHDLSAIRCDGSSCSIHDNILHDGDFGVRLVNSPATVTANVITSVASGIDGLASDATVNKNVCSNCGGAINFNNSSPVIEDNSISREGADFACTGITAIGSSGPASSFTPIISGNTVKGMMTEGILCNGVTPTITGNTLDQNYENTVTTSSQADVTGNVVTHSSTGLIVAAATASIGSNTLDGNVIGMSLQGSTFTVSGNIVSGGSYGIECYALSVTLSCNDVFGANTSLYTGCPDPTGSNGNISVDPQFCGVAASGNYFLQSDSPCAPGNHPDGADCGVIGALPVNCQTTTTETKTWGGVKSLYRK